MIVIVVVVVFILTSTFGEDPGESQRGRQTVGYDTEKPGVAAFLALAARVCVEASGASFTARANVAFRADAVHARFLPEALVGFVLQPPKASVARDYEAEGQEEKLSQVSGRHVVSFPFPVKILGPHPITLLWDKEWGLTLLRTKPEAHLAIGDDESCSED